MFSSSECTDMLLILGECQRNADTAATLYARRYPNRIHPSRNVFRRLEHNLRETGTFKKPHVRTRRVTDENTEAALIETVTNDPHVSQRSLSQTHHISKGSVYNILKANEYHPYHCIPVQHLSENDFLLRLQFCAFVRNQLNLNPNFVSHTLFSDEATFTNNGCFNRHNSHYYSQANPHWFQESHFQCIFKVNVWCSIVGDHVIGPHFFNGNLTGAIYLDFLINILPQLLEEVPLNIRRTMWFQNDGAPPHFHRDVRNHLTRTFGHRVIARGAQHPWPPRSPDFNSLDFFLWGKVKNDVYQQPIANENELRERIIVSCRSVTPETLSKVRRNFLRRINLCEQNNGMHFEHLL